MADSTPTAMTFRDPLLKVLGHLTGLSPGTVVKMEEVLAAIYEETGIAEDAHGDDPSFNRPRVRVWITQAFNRKLKPEGLATAPRRGSWTLTEKGVEVSRLLQDDAPEPPETTTTVKVESEPEPNPEPQIHTGGEPVSWWVGAQEDTYEGDGYIQGLALDATPCAGFWSSRSEVCKDCPLSGSCKEGLLSRMSAIGAALREEDEKESKRAKDRKSKKDNPDPPPDEDDDGDSTPDVEDLLNAIRGEDTGTKPIQMDVSADTRCGKCKQIIKKGETGIWVRGDGMFHPPCYGGSK
jgi:hypothetical protein